MMESTDISSIVNSMVSQVEEGLSKTNNGDEGEQLQLPTAVRCGLRSSSLQSSASCTDGVAGVNGNAKNTGGGGVSSAGDQKSRPDKTTPFIIPKFGASEDDNGHDDLLTGEQVQKNNALQQQPTSTLPPVNLSNVFSDSCEIDMSAVDNARQLEKGTANSTGDIMPREKRVASSKVQINAAASVPPVASSPGPPSPRSSPRISIAVGGVNLNILKRPDSPGSPYSPSSMSHPSPSSPSQCSESIIGVEDKKEVKAIISGKKECPILKKPNLTLTTDEDTQDASVLFQVQPPSCSNNPAMTNDSSDATNIIDSNSLKQDGQETQSLSDTENNNDIGNLCSPTVYELQEVSVASPSTSSAIPGRGHAKICPPNFPSKDAKPCRSLLKRRAEDGYVQNSNCPPKKKRSITFDGVTVFYFPRTQGFTCVPSQGGSTLGMSSKHVFSQQFSLQEWAAEQRRMHKLMLLRMRKQQQEQQLNGISTQPTVEPRRDEELAGGSNGAPQSSDEEDDSDEIETDSELEAELDGYYFLQPVPTRQRRSMLREAGVKKIDSIEKDECRDIRSSREFCGCSCKLYCDPDTCSCAQANIKCQVDRVNFPCQGCTRDGCGNAHGRVEFNPVRVRTHFIHTLMRLEMDKKNANQANCGLDVDGSSVFSPPSLSSMPSLGRHTSSLSIPMNPSHDLSYGVQQQNQCTIVPHWDSNSMGGTSSSSPYYKRPENLPIGGVNVNYSANNMIRDVAFTTGMELESCVSMGSYTNFHYNSRAQSEMGDVNNFPSHSQHHNQIHFNQHQNHPMQFSTGEQQQQLNMSSSSREDSFDLYSSSFREDSYSENSDESGGSDQRAFPPPPCSTTTNLFNTGPGHSMNMAIPMTMMQHTVDGCLQTVIPDHTRYINNGGGGGPGDNFFGLSHNHHDPPQQSILSSVSDSVSYVGVGGGTMLSSEPNHHILPMTLASHHPDQRLYHQNMMGGTDLLHTPPHYSNVANSHYNSPFTVTNGCVYPVEKSVEVQQQTSFSHCQLATANSVTYTEISNDTSYSKVVLCNNNLQEPPSSSLPCPKNGFQALQLIDGVEAVGEDGASGAKEEEELTSDNFGEIIKKSMVETVSA